MANRDMEGYILLDRNILEWKWWQKHNTLIVFIWLLLKAQFHDSFFGGTKISRGQVATTIGNIGFANKLSVQEVRTSLNSLKSTGEITITRHSRFLVITIVNYNKYQDLTRKRTIKQQSRNNQSTINQQHTNTYNTLNADNTRSARSLPKTIGEIDFDRDLGGMPDLDEMPQEADGTKRDIPQRVRKLFDGDYRAYRRFVEDAVHSKD